MNREVTVLAAGGTIAMSGEPGGPASPELTGEALLASVPSLRALGGLQVRTLAALPSAQLAPADALEIARAAAHEAATGRGVVVTHGTDTLEEVALLTDLLHGGDAPVVFTGAMRPASAPGADGPANLADAVAVAGSATAAGLGVVVVFAGEVHAAREARKADSTSPAGFHSPQLGPLGRIQEGRVGLGRRPARRRALEVAHLDAWVETVSAGLGADGRLIEAAVAAGVDGLVAVVLGAGHAPPPFMAALESAAARIPVVATVRPERGAIVRDSYAFAGSERDLRAGAIVAAGRLSPAHARVQLMACLGAGLDRGSVAAAFAADDG